MNTLNIKEPQYVIGIDAHKKFSMVSVINNDIKGELKCQAKIMHNKLEYQRFFSQYSGNAKAAIESTYNWYWMADILQSLNIELHLSNPNETKAIANAKIQNDKVDSLMLAKLLKNNLLPEAYLAPPEIRDKRELLRYRMYISHQLTSCKNRIHSILDKYNINQYNHSDLFSSSGISYIHSIKSALPEYTQEVLVLSLDNLCHLKDTLHKIEIKIHEIYGLNEDVKLLDTIPGVSYILALVIFTETGEIERFNTHEGYCLYCGTAPCNIESASKIYSCRLTPACNHYLKWAFIEASNVVVATECNDYLFEIYKRTKIRRGPSVAKTAVARRQTMGAYYILKKNEPWKNFQRTELVKQTGK